MNKYPLWKYGLIAVALVFGVIYAMPNLYPPDAAIQISGENAGTQVDDRVLAMAQKALDDAGLPYKSAEITTTAQSSRALIRLATTDEQLKAQAALERKLGDAYIVAMNLAPTTPTWLSDLGASPMKLGLDLSGGVHFLLEVDTDVAVTKRVETFASDIKTLLREKRIRGLVEINNNKIQISFRKAELRDKASSEIRTEFGQLTRLASDEADKFLLDVTLPETLVKEIEDYAVTQNLTTLRNRVNELGVAEPLVQKQGRNRIVVELPGVQDTAEAKRILGKTANLEFRLEAKPDSPSTDREQFDFRGGKDLRGAAWLERDVVITGQSVANAQSNFDENGRPQVNITLDSQGGKLMHRSTRNNIKRNLGVLFIERKTKTRIYRDADGVEQVSKSKYDQREIISLATIQSALGTSFRITGLDSVAEASELALLLRAGALAAPIDFVEERTVGPSLGAENIQVGLQSVMIGLALVVVTMIVIYKVFGVAANIALAFNLTLLVAVMSLMSATLTLPGIAGIVLTVGMAVDANVLIFARIREELKGGSSPQTAISAGYDRAFVTILDANITTLLVAIILYAVGTGPVRGFAVTLSVGIVTSMFTAIVCTRAIINLIYGGRKVEKLAI